MKRTLALCCLLVAFITIACETKPLPSQVKSEVPAVPKVIVEKEKAEQEQPLPAEVKIKLKRDGKDNYSWELNGSDADQILKVNEKLRKQLGREQTK
jgi:hypothetical protein